MMFAAYTKEFRYTLTLAAPVILGLLGHTFVGFVDNIMVGQLGATELAAVSLGNSFVYIAMALGIGFSTAITPLIAEADAANDSSNGKSVYKHGLFLCTTLGVLLFIMIWFARPLLYHMNQPPEVVALAIPYLNLVAASLIPLLVFQALKQCADGLSITTYPMYATLLGNVINIGINYALIFGKLGCPKMGLVGAAIGTIVSRLVMTFGLWMLLRRHQPSRLYVTAIRLFTLRSQMLWKVISLGFPSALQMLFEVAVFTAAIWLSGILGTNAQAANQIALNLSSMTFMVAMGLSVAAMVRVGNQKGLQQFVALRRIAFSIILLTFYIEIVFAVVFIIFHTSLPYLYLDVEQATQVQDTMEVVTIASKLLIISALFQISDGIQAVVLGALRGLQDVWIPMAITFVAYWIVGFPVSYYLGLHTEYRSMGIWMGLLAGLTTSAVLLGLRFNALSKTMIRDRERNA